MCMRSRAKNVAPYNATVFMLTLREYLNGFSFLSFPDAVYPSFFNVSSLAFSLHLLRLPLNPFHFVNIHLKPKHLEEDTIFQINLIYPTLVIEITIYHNLLRLGNHGSVKTSLKSH